MALILRLPDSEESSFFLLNFRYAPVYRFQRSQFLIYLINLHIAEDDPGLVD